MSPKVRALQVAPDLWHPVVKVEIVIEGARREGQALIDSGADASLVPWDWVGDRFDSPDDLPLSRTRQLSAGADGSVETRNLVGGELYFDGRLLCRDFEVAAPEAQLDYVLLGRDDFFVRYRIEFRLDKRSPVVSVLAR